MSELALTVVTAAVTSALCLAVYHTAVARRSRGGVTAGVAPYPAGAGEAAGGEAVERRTHERLAELERVAGHDVYRLGFVRYNSFADVGAELSFALALLNRAGDGVVVSSIYSREETRTFGKSVRRFVPQQDASQEEHQAIAMARTGIGS